MADSIRVTPETLNALAEQIRDHGQKATEVLADTAGKARRSVDASELQAALDAFNRVWHEASAEACNATNDLATAVVAAGRHYRDGDNDIAAMLQPGSSLLSGPTPAPGSVEGYLHGVTGTRAQDPPGGPLGDVLPPGDSVGRGTSSSPDSVSDYVNGLGQKPGSPYDPGER